MSDSYSLIISGSGDDTSNELDWINKANEELTQLQPNSLLRKLAPLLKEENLLSVVSEKVSHLFENTSPETIMKSPEQIIELLDDEKTPEASTTLSGPCVFDSEEEDDDFGLSDEDDGVQETCHHHLCENCGASSTNARKSAPVNVPTRKLRSDSTSSSKSVGSAGSPPFQMSTAPVSERTPRPQNSPGQPPSAGTYEPNTRSSKRSYGDDIASEAETPITPRPQTSSEQPPPSARKQKKKSKRSGDRSSGDITSKALLLVAVVAFFVLCSRAGVPSATLKSNYVQCVRQIGVI